MEFDLDSFDGMVTIIVGNQRKPFYLHKSLLCRISSYFEAALNGGFKEAIEQTIEMPEEDAETFRHFQFWLYTKSIKMATHKQWDIEWKQLISLYIFGEARGIPSLANAAIDGVIEKYVYTWWTPLDQITYVYDNTTSKSPLRQLFVDFMVSGADFRDDSWFGEVTFHYYTKEFLYDLAIAQCKVRKGLGSVVVDFKAQRSRYHITAAV